MHVGGMILGFLPNLVRSIKTVSTWSNSLRVKKNTSEFEWKNKKDFNDWKIE